MLEYTNKIEFLGYYGSDETHLQALYLEKDLEFRMGNMDMRLSDMRKYIEVGNLLPFQNSSFTFLLRTDYLSYITLVQNKIGKINDIPFNGKGKEPLESYYIPYDWNSLRVQNDVGDFAKKGDFWYNILMKYTELGKQLEKEFGTLNWNMYSTNRSKTVSKLFRTVNNHVEYSIILNFEEFVRFFREYTKYGYTAELQEVAYFMLDSITKIEGKPFKQSLRVFELNKE